MMMPILSLLLLGVLVDGMRVVKKEAEARQCTLVHGKNAQHGKGCGQMAPGGTAERCRDFCSSTPSCSVWTLHDNGACCMWTAAEAIADGRFNATSWVSEQGFASGKCQPPQACLNVAGEYTRGPAASDWVTMTQRGCSGVLNLDVGTFEFTVSGAVISAPAAGVTAEISAGPPYTITWSNGAIYTPV